MTWQMSFENASKCHLLSSILEQMDFHKRKSYAVSHALLTLLNWIVLLLHCLPLYCKAPHMLLATYASCIIIIMIHCLKFVYLSSWITLWGNFTLSYRNDVLWFFKYKANSRRLPVINVSEVQTQLNRTIFNEKWTAIYLDNCKRFQKTWTPWILYTQPNPATLNSFVIPQRPIGESILFSTSALPHPPSLHPLLVPLISHSSPSIPFPFLF